MAGAWGAAEASFFFVVPDVWIGLIGLLAPRKAPAAFAALVGGAVVGALLLAVVSRVAGDAVASYQASLPGLSDRALAHARSELAEHGLGAMLGLPLQGFPVKVGVHESVQLRYPLPEVLLFTFLNRLVRVGPYATATALAGVVASGWMSSHPRQVVALYLAGWSAFYGWYWLIRPA